MSLVYNNKSNKWQGTQVDWLAYMQNNMPDCLKAKNITAAFAVAKNKLVVQQLKETIFDGIENLKPRKWGSHGKDIIRAINSLTPYLNQREVVRLINAAIKQNDLFYPYARKELATVLINLTNDSDEVVKIFETFYRAMDDATINSAMTKINGGMENVAVKAVLEKTGTLAHLKYDEGEIKANVDKKRELLKDIAYTITAAKKLGFELDVNLDDLKSLPPALRFKFLQNAYEPEIKFARGWTSYGYYKKYKLHNIRDAFKLSKLKMPVIGEDDMKELLFSVALTKNEEMGNWFKQYQRYLALVNKK